MSNRFIKNYGTQLAVRAYMTSQPLKNYSLLFSLYFNSFEPFLQ